MISNLTASLEKVGDLGHGDEIGNVRLALRTPST
jgi:hypothetical protein